MRKAFTFLPGHRSDRQDSESGGTSSTLFKRREQLRKAQRTHRLRKDRYFKNLESEVLRLRANEVNLAIQVQNLRNHVDVLQGILNKHDLSSIPATLSGLTSAEGVFADLSPPKSSNQHYGDVQTGFNSWGSKAGTDFEGTDPSLRLSSTNIYNGITSDGSINSPGQPIESTNSHQPDPSFCQPILTSLPQPMDSQSRCAEQHFNRKMTDMGMEFVLSLEHPCLPHLERHADKPNGHALLASTILVHPHSHQCPPSTLSKDAASPQNPASIFDNLLALSEELVLDDELSPTQAWCYILQQPWANKLDLDTLRGLSASLLRLIKCHGFGAVMKRDEFEAILYQIPQPSVRARKY